MYEKSYMHRDWVTHVVVTASDFVVTASRDGQLKFWKKMQRGIEFMKHFRAHLAPLAGVDAGPSSRYRGRYPARASRWACTCAQQCDLRMYVARHTNADGWRLGAAGRHDAASPQPACLAVGTR